MAEFDDLLAGIRAFPADELRRLVFADWLDENAHRNPVYAPWASYIRWAVAADRTPRTDPDYWKYRRYPESPPPGVAKLLGADVIPSRAEWQGGFPDVLALAVDTLQEHDRRIATFAGPIRRLSISPRYQPPPSAPSLLPSGFFPGGEAVPQPIPLRWVGGPTVARAGALDVSLNEADAPPVLAALAAQAGKLPPLSLSVPATEAVTGALVRRPFPSLVGLTLSGLDDAARLADSPNLGNLTSLSVSSRSGSYAGLPAALPKLARLSIGDNGREEFLTALAGGSSPALAHLETTAMTAASPGWAEFAASPAFGRLTRLHWSRSEEDTDTPVWPAGAPEPDAGDLILNANLLGPRQSAALFSSPLLHRCACLFVVVFDTSLTSPRPFLLTPDAYVALAENPSARNLKVLSLQMPFKSAPVASGAPLAALCRSPHLAGLTELSLTFHSLTDDDFGELLTATFADNLRYLNLAGSYFSERMLARLLDPDVMPQLTWLDIHGPKEANHPLGVAFRERFGPNFAF